MTEVRQFNFDRLSLEGVGIDQLRVIINESEDAFLPLISNPTQTTTDLFEKLKTLPKFQPYGYRINGELVSYIILLGHKVSSTISIGPMYIMKKYQGQGLGLRQVNDFMRLVEARGYSSIYTKTWSENIPSRRIFENLGFKVSGIKQNDRANGDSTVEYIYKF